MNDVELIKAMRSSPLFFIERVWKLVPQEKGKEFIKGEHVTWQQTEILQAVERAIRGEAPKRISVVAGHGIGKDAVLSWLIHWFLFTRKNAQIGCTAPTSDQMYDVLWKELMVWHQKLPEGIKKFFEWTTTHYKIVEAPETWWARARTAKKEAPEAFAGLHGEHVMLVGDEASGIPDEVFKVGEGALTNKDTLVVLMSNGRRLEGVFYDTHHKDKANWQCLSFDSRESPIVEVGFCDRIKAKYGEDSDEFSYMVAGGFPKEGGVLEGGWMPLLSQEEVRFVPDVGGLRKPKLGIDPAGEGSNKSVFVLRDNFRAKVAATEDKSTPKSVAETALTIDSRYEMSENEIIVDNFGEGANVSQEIALGAHKRVLAINVGDKPDNPDRFLNKRSELYWRLREWIIKGGELVKHELWSQLFIIYYKRNLSGKIQIMSKEEMARKGWDSPDAADALSMTFARGEDGDGKPIKSVEEPDEAMLREVIKMY